MRKAIVATCMALSAIGLPLSSSAQEHLVVTFQTAVGDAPVPGATASLQLNADGTISATVTSLTTWQLIGFGLDSSVPYESHDFSAPTDAASTIADTEFGGFYTAWFAGLQPAYFTMSWVIGMPGSFTSVTDVIDGDNSPFDAFVYVYQPTPFGVTSYYANFLTVAPVPEPETVALLGAGMALLALRRRRKLPLRGA